MTDAEQQEVQRRARQDAVAMRSGWEVRCPYSNVEQATEWRRLFELALAETKVSKE